MSRNARSKQRLRVYEKGNNRCPICCRSTTYLVERPHAEDEKVNALIGAGIARDVLPRRLYQGASGVLWSCLVVSVSLWTAVAAVAQPRVRALAVDASGRAVRLGVDYETTTTAAAQAVALRECGCSLVLTFGRCGAYAANQDADSTAAGWGQNRMPRLLAREAALHECGSRGGSGCVVRVWGCNGQVIGEGLNRAVRGGWVRSTAAGCPASSGCGGVSDHLVGAAQRHA